MLSSKLDSAQLAKNIGARLRAARELTNLTQTEAAKRLGYQNSSKLSKIENGSDTRSVPLPLIFKAAKLYEVSVDYLFGLSDDWEIDVRMTQEREVSRWLFETWEKARERDMDVLRKLHNRIEALERIVGEMVTSSADAQTALQRFMELNPEFNDLRAGNRLVHYVFQAADAAHSAKLKMLRFHMECKVAACSTSQLSLGIGAGCHG